MRSEPHAPRPLSIAIAALGGQGGGVLAEWLVATAELHGWIAQSTSVPGVAQRTGTTVYYVETCPEPAPGAKPPVLALMPVPGDVDVVVAAELMEAGRTIVRGLVTPTRTTLIASEHRVYGITEKSAMGDGIADSKTVLAAAKAEARRLVCFDMEAVAADSDAVISSVLLGAVAGSGALPFPRALYEQAIRESGVAVKSNLAGFAAGFEKAVSGARAEGLVATPPQPTTAAGREIEARVRATMPAHLYGLVLEGVRRLMDYQDARHATDYLDRLDEVLGWERTHGGNARHHALTAAVARHLALWMSYEDTIRVADLKTRATRFQRFRGEIRADAEQIVHVAEFMHPRWQELCETLPAGLGTRLLASESLRKLAAPLFARGRHVQTSRLPGFLLLSLVARLQRFRRGTLRWQLERERIAAWLQVVRDAAAVDYDLACELAQCQRLVKGYGDTHERGLRNFETIVGYAHTTRDRAGLADRVRELRSAALADEDGRALQAALARLGIAPAGHAHAAGPGSPPPAGTPPRVAAATGPAA